VAYRVELSKAAERQFKGLSRRVQARLTSRIDRLAEDPRPPGSKRLSGAQNLYRIRIGDYRVIYAIQHEVLLVLVLKVGHRREVYRRLLD
jgi:mRNA interferase RelE/StbE